MVKIKFNGGKGALLCEQCSVIIAAGDRIPNEYKWNPGANEYIFCSKECMDKWLAGILKRCKILDYGKLQ